ncbi:VOC family protein [Tumebacillus avium]|nr:VOC family protein [Tumebacillus avium]
MQFRAPQINLYVENLEVSKAFYERLGFQLTFTAVIEGQEVHHELVLDGFKLGIATKESTREVHGLTPGSNAGCEIVVWTEDTDAAIHYLLENGATLLSEPHDFLHNLRSGWVKDPDGNPIQIVCKRAQQVINSETFKKKIEEIMEEARSAGKESVDICAGDVHSMVGGYPSSNHRMASCCEVMYSMQKPTDEVLYAPPKGKGATLRIRYYL